MVTVSVIYRSSSLFTYCVVEAFNFLDNAAHIIRVHVLGGPGGKQLEVEADLNVFSHTCECF